MLSTIANIIYYNKDYLITLWIKLNDMLAKAWVEI